MKKGWGKWAVLLAILLVAAFVALFFADRIQRADGAISITEGYLPSEVGDLFYKLYTPSGLKDGEKYVLSRNKLQIEVLQNLDRVAPAGALLIAAWPNIKGATGMPVRAFAVTPKAK